MTIDRTHEPLLAALNAPDRARRLAAAAEVGRLVAAGTLAVPRTDEVNNHVHTIYSFSPYSPTLAAWRAYAAGLQAVGAMDHDSVAGAEEMLDAGRALGIATTVGFEIRVDFSTTSMAGRKLNNPDSLDITYIAVHGVPRGSVPAAAAFLAPLQAARNRRNEAMVDRINGELGRHGLPPLGFERDVLPLSRAAEGGTVTERHLMCAVANLLLAEIGRGARLVSFLRDALGLEVPAKVAGWLAEPANPHEVYDVIGVLKSGFVERVFVQPGPDECRPVQEVVSFAKGLSAIPVYSYLGDVGESPTGDKKAERFEDAYLDELMDEVERLGFQAVTYMPPRNTREQLRRIQALCRQHGFMEVSGVDINSSRQAFNCPIILDPEFRHLVGTTWALIAHEKLASLDERYALFHPRSPYAALPLDARLALYAKVGERIDPRAPEKALDVLTSLH